MQRNAANHHGGQAGEEELKIVLGTALFSWHMPPMDQPQARKEGRNSDSQRCDTNALALEGEAGGPCVHHHQPAGGERSREDQGQCCGNRLIGRPYDTKALIPRLDTPSACSQEGKAGRIKDDSVELD